MDSKITIEEIDRQNEERIQKAIAENAAMAGKAVSVIIKSWRHSGIESTCGRDDTYISPKHSVILP